MPPDAILNHYEFQDPVEVVSQSRRDLYLNFLIYANSILGKPGKILDIGCSRGDFLALAVQHGWDGYGIEPVEHLAGLAQGKGLNVISGALAQIPTDWGDFDIITYWDVFMFVDDPVRELERAISHLEKDGWIYFRLRQHSMMKKMDRLWKIFRRVLKISNPAVYHPHNYSPKTMKMLALKMNLNVKIENSKVTKGDPYGLTRSVIPVIIMKAIISTAAWFLGVISGGKWVLSTSMDVWIQN